MRSLRIAALLAVALSAYACSNSKQSAALASAIGAAVAAPSPSDVPADTWADVERFYQSRSFQPVWISSRRQAAEAQRAIDFLSEAQNHGLNPVRYGGSDLQALLTELAQDQNTSELQLARADIALTTSVLRLGHDIAVGVVRPEQINRGWKHRRDTPDLSATLARSLADLPAWVRTIQPPHPEYEAAHQALDRLITDNESIRDDAQGISEQRAQLAANMERWRWMPDNLGERHLFVNIPSFELRAREHGQTVLSMPVVVGKAKGHETPVFSGMLETVVFSPTWNVPDTIAEAETAPAVAKDIDYLERNGIEVFARGRSRSPIDPRSVDWNDRSAVKQLVFRQRPGAKNALGGVKFLFPNSFNVYLHDTPADSLFARPSRAFSHGCVRLANPEGLAAYVLRDAPEWDAQAIHAAMISGQERAVSVKTINVPIHIVYFTAWLTDAGEVRYEADVYGYDKKQLALSSAAEIE